MEGSYSVSQSKEQQEQMHSANAMEEYMKKQNQKKGGAPPAAKPERKKGQRSGKDISESSDKYTDEDFESYSKS